MGGAKRGTMSKSKMTFSIPDELVEYLRAQPNASSVVAEAVEEYRASELEAILEDAYRQDAAENETIHRDWEVVDAEVTE